MAIYNEILAPRYARFLQKLLSMKGEPGAQQLAGEFMATFVMSSGAENKFLEGWILHSWETVFAGSPAALNAAMLRNPVGSNIVAVLTKVSATSLLSDQFVVSMGPRTTDLPTPITLPAPSNFDARYGASSRSLLTASIQQAAGPGTAPPDRGFFAVGASGTYDMIIDATEEVPLLPGWAISVRNNVVNQTNGVTFWWRERVLEDSELSA